MSLNGVDSIERNGVIERAVAVLDAFDMHAPRLPLGEVARRAGLPLSTTRRLLVQLSDVGLVHQEGDTGMYTLSVRFVHFGSVALESVDIVRLAQPVLSELAQRTSEAAFLGRLEPQGVVYLSVVQPSVPIQVTTRAGEVRPAHCTSIGKALLAELPPQDLDAWLDTHDLVPTTNNVITDRDAYKSALETVRIQGYAVNYQESSLEFASVAAPIRDHTATAVGAIAVSGPVYRIPRSDIPAHAAAVQSAAREVSALLGNQAAINAGNTG